VNDQILTCRESYFGRVVHEGERSLTLKAHKIIEGCKHCGHLAQQVTLSGGKVCGIGHEPDRWGTCPEFYNGYISEVLSGKR